jgi:hypothetical protein
MILCRLGKYEGKMQKRTAVLSAAIGVVCVAGCQSSASVNRTAPTSEAVKNSVTVNQDFDTTWDGLIKNLSSRFFVINNVEKVSRIMNVSFSADDPTQYADCGETTRKFKSGTGSEEIFTFKNAAATIHFKAVAPNGVAYEAVNQQRLEGRANVYVAPNGNLTDIAVNVRYVIQPNVTVVPIHQLYGTPIGPAEHPTNQPYTFDTGNPGTTAAEGSNITCRSNGKLEQMILDAAKQG